MKQLARAALAAWLLLGPIAANAFNAHPGGAQPPTFTLPGGGGSGSAADATFAANLVTDPPGPSPTLYAAPFYSCVRNFYVATTGNDTTGTGAIGAPWLTIQHADSASRTGGDCINVAAGTYNASVQIQHGGTGPTDTGYVVYRCQTLDGCHVLANSSGHLWGFEQPANFVAVDGFELDGNSALGTPGIADACIDTDDATYGVGQSSHHIWSLNNIVHNCNESGVQFNNKEWFYVIHTSAFNNSWSSGFQGSGFSLVVLQCIESGNAACAADSNETPGSGNYTMSGMDLTFKPPYHNLIIGNMAHDNRIESESTVACGAHTDGNGFIMDTWSDNATLTIQYAFQSIVAENLAYNNGGGGIHIFASSHILVANNTAYGNGTDTCINASTLGDLSNSGGHDNIWVNNVAVSVLTAHNTSVSGCTQSGNAFCGGTNSPFTAGNGRGIVDANNTFTSNIFNGGTGVQLFDNDTSTYNPAINKATTDPKFVNPTQVAATANFALQSTSPAIGYGQAGFYGIDSGSCPAALTACL